MRGPSGNGEGAIRGASPRARRCGWRIAALLPLVLAPAVRAADAVDAERFVVVKAGRVITVSGEVYSPGMIVIADGVIRLVGKTLEYPPTATVIDARRQTVMPGLIHPRSRLNLPSYSRNGVHGDRTAADEVYLGEIDFDFLLRAGYTAVAFYPAGTGIPGRASVYHTGGPEDARLVSNASYLRITMSTPSRDKRGLRSALQRAKQEIEKGDKARKEWKKKQADKKKAATTQTTKPATSQPASRPATQPADDKSKATTKPAESDAFEPPKIDPAHQPLVDLIQKKATAPALIELSRASGLLHLDEVLEPYDGFDHAYDLTGNARADFHYVVDQLGERKARALVRPEISRLPLTATRYNLAARLARAGGEVSFVPTSDSRLEYERVRMRVADVVRAGLDREHALRALTLHPARLLGVADRLGSIEKGRDADLVFFDRHPLAPGSTVQRVMIRGETVWPGEDAP